MSEQPLTIVKVGGSLLEWAELPRRLTAWIKNRREGVYLLIAGAGPLGDVIRDANARFQLGEERSHWLCIDVLSTTARLLSHLLDVALVIDSTDALRQIRNSPDPTMKVCVFDPRSFLRDNESAHGGKVLPHTWDVTTDSIAARLAECLSADELVLFKSCDPPATDIEALCHVGYVDRYFALAASSLNRIAVVNLRGTGEMIPLRRLSHER